MISMNDRARSMFINQFMKQIETHIYRYQRHRQPPIEDIVRHINLLSVEMGLDIRFYWKNGYEIDYNVHTVDKDIKRFPELHEKFVKEYDLLLLPEKTDIAEEYTCVLEDDP